MKGRREGWRNGGMKGWRDGGREGGREERRDGGREGGIDGGMEGRRDGEMEGGMPIGSANSHIQKTSIQAKFSVWKNSFVYNNMTGECSETEVLPPRSATNHEKRRPPNPFGARKRRTAKIL